MDWIDRGLALSGAVAGIAFVIKALTGFNLLQPRSANSLLGKIGFAALWVALILAAIDTFRPVRTTLYLVNADSAAQQVAVGDRHGCLPALSFAILRWRTPPRRALLITGAHMEDSVTAKLGPGVWVANFSTTKILADFVDTTDFGQSSATVEDQNVIRAPVDHGKIFRILTDLSVDRLYSTTGDIQQAAFQSSCRPSGP